MIHFIIILLFYVNGALVEDEFDSDNFENFYTVIPVLSEVKYPKMSPEGDHWHETKYWDKFQSAPVKRHLKMNETKEALESENTKMVFDLLNKLNLSVNKDLVPNLILLGNKFNMNLSKPEEVLKKSELELVWARSESKVEDTTMSNSKDKKSADYKPVKHEQIFRSNQIVTSTGVTIIQKDETQINTKHIDTYTQVITGKPIRIPNNRTVFRKLPGIWINGQCRCNYIFRSGSYIINPNFYYIIFFDVLSCVFGK